jgi:hypothetical protein
MAPEITFQSDVFHGELTANRAQVFVRVPRTPDNEGCQLIGYVHGPHCEYAHTLPAKFVLQDLGSGPTLLARAIITDPCLWTGDLPQLYDVHIELRRGSTVLASEKRTIGLRGLGVRAASGRIRFVREGKVWVPRGVGIRSLTDEALTDLREELLVGFYQGVPPLDWLQTASRRGLYLIVELPERARNLAELLKQLARWPAVMLAVLPSPFNTSEPDPALRQVAPNLLLGQRLALHDLDSLEPAAWAQAVLATTSFDGTRVAVPAIRDLGLPVILQGTRQSAVAQNSNRAACDALQAAAANRGQFAGYLVTGS